MVQLKHSFNLFQPWADEVAVGAMPYLVRSVNTHKRSRVGINATNTIDKIWLKTADKKWIDKTLKNIKTGIIGSINIADTIETNQDDLEKELTKIAGKKYVEKYYPNYLIPNTKKVYIWILDKPKKWDEPVTLTKRIGINWTNINIEDK